MALFVGMASDLSRSPAQMPISALILQFIAKGVSPAMLASYDCRLDVAAARF
jgi:hypothetical protein